MPQRRFALPWSVEELELAPPWSVEKQKRFIMGYEATIDLLGE
jgi:hypothetical protein